MRSVLIILFALLSVQASEAQSELPDSLPRKKLRWYQAIRFRAPEFILDRYFPFKQQAFATLPNPMDKYMSPTKGGMGTIGFTNYYSFRLIGLFYKDRIGLELYTGGFGAKVKEQPFNDYLVAKFPDHYNNILTNQYHDYTYSGWQYGLAYKHHWKGLVLEPKFILGFEKMDAYTQKWRFKEMGSNQTTEYQFSYWDSTRNNRSYHLQLRLAKRYKVFFQEQPLWLELGFKTEYIVAAKRQVYIHMTEKSYDKPTIEESLLVPMRYKSFAVGLFFTMYFKNAHLHQ